MVLIWVLQSNSVCLALCNHISSFKDIANTHPALEDNPGTLHEDDTNNHTYEHTHTHIRGKPPEEQEYAPCV